MPAVTQSQPQPDTLRGTYSHHLQVTVPSARVPPVAPACPVRQCSAGSDALPTLPAQAHQCGYYQSVPRHSRKVIRIMFFMSGFHQTITGKLNAVPADNRHSGMHGNWVACERGQTELVVSGGSPWSVPC